MTIKKNYEELQQALIEDDNINVGKSSDLRSFFILVSGIIGIIITVFLLFGLVSDLFIDKMSDETQMKIEKMININLYGSSENNSNELQRLNKIKSRIVNADYSLKNKSSFPMKIMPNNEVNACIFPNGTIYVTQGALNQNFTDEELSFVLAHEIGHYAHRDHLKAFGRQILAGLIYITISGSTNSSTRLINGVTDLSNLSHSRSQESEADKYAGEALIKIYGNNNGGKSFIIKIKKQQDSPDYLQYFSTHPSWNERLKILESQNR